VVGAAGVTDNSWSPPTRGFHFLRPIHHVITHSTLFAPDGPTPAVGCRARRKGMARVMQVAVHVGSESEVPW